MTHLTRGLGRLPGATDSGAQPIVRGRPVAFGLGAAFALLLLVAPASVSAADPLGGLTEPLTEPILEPVEPHVEPVVSIVEPVSDAVVEPVVTRVEPVIQPASDAVVQPVAKAVVQPVADGILEPVTSAIQPVVEQVAQETEPLAEPLIEEPIVEPPAYEPPDAPEWQPAVDPLPNSEPARPPEEPAWGWPANPGLAFDASPAAGTSQLPGSRGAASDQALIHKAGDSPFLTARSTPAEDSSSSTGPTAPALLPLPLPGAGSEAVLGSFSIGLAIGLALLLLFLMPPPFLVRRLNLAATFWRPLCFVSPIERPG